MLSTIVSKKNDFDPRSNGCFKYSERKFHLK